MEISLLGGAKISPFLSIVRKSFVVANAVAQPSGDTAA